MGFCVGMCDGENVVSTEGCEVGTIDGYNGSCDGLNEGKWV